MQEKEKPKRPPGARLGRGIAKTEIIRYVINKNNPVTESDIKKHLREKYNIRDPNNIEDHLKKLKTKYNCLEQIQPLRNGLDSYWIIEKIENLQNEKSLDIIVKERLFDTRSRIAPRFRDMLSLSDSFFEMCLTTDFEVLTETANEMYKYGAGSALAKRAEKCICAVYPECIKRLSRTDDFLRIDFTLYINDSPILENFKKSKISFPWVEISKERFLEILEEIPIMEWGEISFNKLNPRILEELADRIYFEILHKLEKNRPEEFQEIPKKILTKVQNAIFTKIVTTESEEMCENILELKYYQEITRVWGPYTLFKYAFYSDIKKGTVSSKEISYVQRLKTESCTFIDSEKVEPMSVQQRVDGDFYTHFKDMALLFDNFY
jgi:hypothetical protein